MGLLKKKSYETYKNTNNSHSVQSLHLICQVVQIQQKTFKVLIALLFLTYAKKGAVLFFDSLEEVCNRVCSFLYVHELFSNKKKKVK